MDGQRCPSRGQTKAQPAELLRRHNREVTLPLQPIRHGQEATVSLKPGSADGRDGDDNDYADLFREPVKLICFISRACISILPVTRIQNAAIT